MVAFRRAVADAPLQSWQSFNEGDVVAFARGSVGFLALNRGDMPFRGQLQTQLPSGVYTDILGESSISVRPDGTAQVEIGSVKALALLGPMQNAGAE